MDNQTMIGDGRVDFLVRYAQDPSQFFHPPAEWYVNPGGEITKHHRRLPHWQQNGALYFVTWRLGDSLPKEKLDLLRAEKEAWRRLHPEPWNDETAETFHRHSVKRIEQWLDAGEGACLLRHPDVAKIVADALLHFEGQRCDMGAFVIMPNHVHVLFRLRPEIKLQDIMKSWKGFTSRRINQHLDRQGNVWEQEYWDRLVRDESHWEKCWKYILSNPERAKLRADEYCLWVRPKEGENSNK